jgi:predicted RNA polymerase sigma factor
VSAADPHHATHRTIEAVWRIESARVIAGLTRLTRDVGLAEDLAQEALLAALEQWPQSGVPENPGAWLTATAKRRAIDLFRRKLRASIPRTSHRDIHSSRWTKNYPPERFIRVLSQVMRESRLGKESCSVCGRRLRRRSRATCRSRYVRSRD